MLKPYLATTTTAHTQTGTRTMYMYVHCLDGVLNTRAVHVHT